MSECVLEVMMRLGREHACGGVWWWSGVEVVVRLDHEHECGGLWWWSGREVVMRLWRSDMKVLLRCVK